MSVPILGTVADGREPERALLALAERVFEQFRAGAQTGDWTGYAALMSEDYVFWYPVPGPFHGRNEGKQRALSFFEDSAETTARPQGKAFPSSGLDGQ